VGNNFVYKFRFFLPNVSFFREYATLRDAGRSTIDDSARDSSESCFPKRNYSLGSVVLTVAENGMSIFLLGHLLLVLYVVYLELNQWLFFSFVCELWNNLSA